MFALEDVLIPMRDGTRITANVYGDSSITSPAVVIRTPYVKDRVCDPAHISSPWTDFTADGFRSVSAEAVPSASDDIVFRTVNNLVERGYIVVLSDTRGTGYSEGVYDYYNLQAGRYDGFDSIEWVADQAWCNGNVGMWGISASGVLAYSAAITRPPHLKAIAAYMCPADFYLDQWFPSGVFRYEDRMRWIMSLEHSLWPLDPGASSSPLFSFRRAVFEDRYRSYYERLRHGESPFNVSWAAQAATHVTYDDFWKEMSLWNKLDAVTVPVLNIGVLFDHFIRGTLRYQSALRSTHQFGLLPGGLDVKQVSRDDEFDNHVIAWFDSYLRGESEPDSTQTRFFLTGVDCWTTENSWGAETGTLSLPLSSSSDRACGVLGGEGRRAVTHLKFDPETPTGTPRNLEDQRDYEARSLVFSTVVLDHDITVVGVPRLGLFVSSDRSDFDICARLVDVQPNGHTRLVQTGVLRASHRFSHAQPTLVVPGEVVQVSLELPAVTHVFQRGHEVRLVLSLSDFPFYEHLPYPMTVFFHTGEATPAVLELPLLSM